MGSLQIELDMLRGGVPPVVENWTRWGCQCCAGDYILQAPGGGAPGRLLREWEDAVVWGVGRNESRLSDDVMLADEGVA